MNPPVSNGAVRRSWNLENIRAGRNRRYSLGVGRLIGEMAGGIDPASNNLAECCALIEGLGMAVTGLVAYINSSAVAGPPKGHRVKTEHPRPARSARARSTGSRLDVGPLCRQARQPGIDAWYDKP